MRLALILVPLILIAALALPVLLPRGDGPPPLRDASSYLTTTQTEIFNGPPAAVIEALQSPETGVLAFVTPTDRIPAIAALVPLEGAFPNEGAVRRVELATGDQVTERVLTNNARAFAYQIWGFTAANARPIDHIRGQFTYSDLGDGRTEVRWDYAVAPRVFWARPFVQAFLDNDFAPFMAAGLTGAAAAFNAAPR
ncbi:SRPBCC family protein [Hasllibacter sp. MH4015]|uniref:SRPBCC family protein n=1 Tax=Hasllibacter sp. MH4015 TaxID=2854029 RepID=UPI001CD508FD|nr:SRPBCC family protein [Hasllibacter sp. MH4015]